MIKSVRTFALPFVQCKTVKLRIHLHNNVKICCIINSWIEISTTRHVQQVMLILYFLMRLYFFTQIHKKKLRYANSKGYDIHTESEIKGNHGWI